MYVLVLILAVMTLYATLGDEAIVHGINETGVTIIITSADLLPKFNVRETPSLTRSLSYLSDSTTAQPGCTVVLSDIGQILLFGIWTIVFAFEYYLNF